MIAPRTICFVVNVPPPYAGRIVTVIGGETSDLPDQPGVWLPVKAAWLDFIADPRTGHFLRPENLKPIAALP